jgi:membrane protein implicated in regulation of membrane protease activity
MGTPKLMLALFGAAALVVGGVGVLALDTWWLLIVAVLALVVASAFVLGYVGRTLRGGDKPDPVTEARLEEEGRL